MSRKIRLFGVLVGAAAAISMVGTQGIASGAAGSKPFSPIGGTYAQAPEQPPAAPDSTGSASVTNSWLAGASYSPARTNAEFALLRNGRVLLAGGVDNDFIYKDSNLYTQSTSGPGTWTSTGAMKQYTAYTPAITLYDGRVLVPGGLAADGVIMSSAQLYSLTTGTWTNTGAMSTKRTLSVAVLLNDGRVLVAGGTSDLIGAESSAEIYDPGTGLWTPTGGMSTPREDATAVLLSSGKVLVAGGDDGSNYLSSTELFDPATGTWSSAGDMAEARTLPVGIHLFNGRVVVIGGANGSGFLNTAELYTPSTNTWSSAGSFTGGRAFFAVGQLYGGSIMIAGGLSGSLSNPTRLSSAQLYAPSGTGGVGTWTSTLSLSSARSSPMSVRLNVGNTLVAGGFNAAGTVLGSTTQYVPSPRPTLNLTPGFGPAGVQVKCSGVGYSAGEVIKVYWGGTFLGSATASASGGYSVTVTTLSNATLGDHVIKAVGQSSGRLAQRWFSTTP